jgi:hypothetical protein
MWKALQADKRSDALSVGGPAGPINAATMPPLPLR